MTKWVWLAVCTFAVLGADLGFHAVVGTPVDPGELISMMGGLLIAVLTFPATTKEPQDG